MIEAENVAVRETGIFQRHRDQPPAERVGVVGTTKYSVANSRVLAACGCPPRPPTWFWAIPRLRSSIPTDGALILFTISAERLMRTG
jgi:hypothetical protein